MFGIGGFELFIIVVFIFVVFGPNKLPEIIKLTGMGIKKFRKAKAEMDKVLQEEIVDPVMKVANEPDPPKKEDKSKLETESKKEEKPKAKTKKNTSKTCPKSSTSSRKKTNSKSSNTKIDAVKKGGK